MKAKMIATPLEAFEPSDKKGKPLGFYVMKLVEINPGGRSNEFRFQSDENLAEVFGELIGQKCEIEMEIGGYVQGYEQKLQAREVKAKAA